MGGIAEIIGKEIARLLAQRFGDAHEIFDIETALIRFRPSQLGRRDSDGSGHVGLAAAFRFAELSEDAAVHAERLARGLPDSQRIQGPLPSR